MIAAARLPLHELEHNLLMAEHEERRCWNNTRAFNLRASIGRDSGNEDAARDNDGLALYWHNQAVMAESRTLELRRAVSCARTNPGA